MASGYVQVAVDSTGKRIANFAVPLPVGTQVTDGDGAITNLAAETTVFLQQVVICDSEGNVIDDFIGQNRQGEIIAELRELRRVVCNASNQFFDSQPKE